MDDPNTYKQQEEKVRATLNDYGINEEESVSFFLCVLRDRGLFWPPQPEPKTTARDIERRARKAQSESEKRQILAGKFQTVRGDRVVPIGPHGRRRPEPEVTYAAQLFDEYLQQALKMPSVRRWACIADVLNAVGGLGTQGPETIRKRLGRARKLRPSEYHLALWRSQVCRGERDPAYLPGRARKSKEGK